MAAFTAIAQTDNLSVARVLVTALRAHGFSPLGDGDGMPGLPGVPNSKGLFEILVPADEAADARMLAEALLADMHGHAP